MLMTSSGSTTTKTQIPAKPFIKWVGGKRQLLEEIDARLPTGLDVYFEPFLGGGAVFFHVANKIKQANLSDVNEELINVYQTVQKNVSGLINELLTHQNTLEHFLKIRDIDRTANYKQNYTSLQKAARFIYLNKTCFNGLYRVNSQGFFNVPYGKYHNPKIVDVDTLYACNEVLSRVGIQLTNEPYQNSLSKIQTMVNLGRDVFVYLDPPYVPLNTTSSFTQYSKNGFSLSDHLALLSYCNILTNLGVKWMQSNSSASIVFEMYKDYKIETLEVKRSVGALAKSRARVYEVIITNY